MANKNIEIINKLKEKNERAVFNLKHDNCMRKKKKKKKTSK